MPNKNPRRGIFMLKNNNPMRQGRGLAIKDGCTRSEAHAMIQEYQRDHLVVGAYMKQQRAGLRWSVQIEYVPITKYKLQREGY
jgi:hypothetical protein